MQSVVLVVVVFKTSGRVKETQRASSRAAEVIYLEILHSTITFCVPTHCLYRVPEENTRQTENKSERSRSVNAAYFRFGLLSGVPGVLIYLASRRDYQRRK